MLAPTLAGHQPATEDENRNSKNEAKAITTGAGHRKKSIRMKKAERDRGPSMIY